VLAEIGAAEVPSLLVLNKLDRVGDEAAQAELQARLSERPGTLVVSVRRPEDVARVRAAIVEHFAASLVETELHVGYDRQALRGEIYASCQVLEESYDEAGVRFRVRARPELLERLRPRLASAR
jgi:GTP-binding protein HflX